MSRSLTCSTIRSTRSRASGPYRVSHRLFVARQDRLPGRPILETGQGSGANELQECLDVREQGMVAAAIRERAPAHGRILVRQLERFSHNRSILLLRHRVNDKHARTFAASGTGSMPDSCQTRATFVNVTREGGELVVNFTIHTDACDTSAGRLSYDYTIVNEDGSTTPNDGNSLEWDAATGNNFFLRGRPQK